MVWCGVVCVFVCTSSEAGVLICTRITPLPWDIMCGPHDMKSHDWPSMTQKAIKIE